MATAHRSCPLCKVRACPCACSAGTARFQPVWLQGTLTSYMHNIRTESDFLERNLPPLPPPVQHPPLPNGPHPEQVALVDMHAWMDRQARQAAAHTARAAPNFVSSSRRAQGRCGHQAASAQPRQQEACSVLA